MREREATKLYNSITDIEDGFVEEAQTVRLARKNRGWIKWCAIAACLCMAAGAFFWLRKPGVEVKEIGSLEEIASSYGDGLLAGRLVASGARTASIRLSYARGSDASDSASWDTLSVTGDYNGQDFTLDCHFGSGQEVKEPAEAYAITQYGDVEVAVYREEDDWTKGAFLYRARFTLDGVAYDLSTHSDTPEELYTYLDMILGEPEGGGQQSGTTLTDVLGFDVCRAEMEEISPYHYEWHFYVEVDGEDVCVAEQFGYDSHPEAWSRDMDGDGVPELICNCTYGDGAQKVIVYRNSNGVIEEGHIREAYYREKFGWSHMGEGGVASYPVELYDPEKGVITATDYYSNGYDDPVAVEIDDGLEPFGFYPFKHLP